MADETDQTRVSAGFLYTDQANSKVACAADPSHRAVLFRSKTGVRKGTLFWKCMLCDKILGADSEIDEKGARRTNKRSRPEQVSEDAIVAQGRGVSWSDVASKISRIEEIVENLLRAQNKQLDILNGRFDANSDSIVAFIHDHVCSKFDGIERRFSDVDCALDSISERLKRVCPSRSITPLGDPTSPGYEPKCDGEEGSWCGKHGKHSCPSGEASGDRKSDEQVVDGGVQADAVVVRQDAASVGDDIAN
jgi:hypothetical protein